MARSKSSKQWLQEHFSDPFVNKAQKEGYRSRAVYKLNELDQKNHLFKPGMTIVDLGAAPGSWSQYVAQKLQGKGKIIALDILPMDNIADVEFILGDFREEETLQKLLNLLPKHGVDVVLSDMAPNMSGNAVIDIPRAMYLAELVTDFSAKMLKTGGVLLMKVFHGTGFDNLIKEVRQQFKQVSLKKPSASRARSRETYLLAKGYHLR